MTTLEKRFANAKKFKEICAKRNLDEAAVNKLITIHASKIWFSPRNVLISARGMQKTVHGDKLSDQSFSKALSIIGLTKEEIQAIMA